MSIRGAKNLGRASAAAALLLTCVAGRPAQAQIFGWSWGGPPSQPSSAQPPSFVAGRLAARGWRILSLRRNGGVYLVDVSDRGGHRRHLILDAYTGAVLQVFAYAPSRPPAAIPDGGPAFGEPPPAAIEPAAPPPRLSPRVRFSEPKSRHKVAKREETPPAATREPSSRPAASPPAKASGVESGSASAGSASAAGASARSDAIVSSPRPVQAPRPAAPPAPAPTGPGYANGVPINPLD